MARVTIGAWRRSARRVLTVTAAAVLAASGTPAQAQTTSAPGAVAPNGNFFVIEDEGQKIRIHEWIDNQWRWEDHGAFGDHLEFSAPSSLSFTGGFYFTATDPSNQLRLLSWQPGGTPQMLLPKLGFDNPGTPSDIMYLNRVFVTSSNNLHEYFVRWSAVSTPFPHPMRDKVHAQKPCVMADGHVFVTSSTGKLLQLWDQPGKGWTWVDHDYPEPGWFKVRAVFVGAGMPSNKVFVTCNDGTLRQRWWTGTKWEWHSHGSPFGWRIDSRAAATEDGKLFVTGDWDHAGGNTRTLLQLYYDSVSGQWIWFDHGRPFGISIDEVGAAVAWGGDRAIVKGVDGNFYGCVWNGTMWVWKSYGQP